MLTLDDNWNSDLPSVIQAIALDSVLEVLL